jgi:hypothetical protein
MSYKQVICPMPVSLLYSVCIAYLGLQWKSYIAVAYRMLGTKFKMGEPEGAYLESAVAI